MIFELLCKNKNNQEEKWFYDNISNCFYDNDLKKRFNNKNSGIDFSIKNAEKFNISEITRLNVCFGYKCNFNCKYCLEKQFKKSDGVINSSPVFVNSFCNNLKKAFGDHQFEEIFFCGGEPLVHWKTLEKLLPKLRELYPESKIRFMTNGSLFTKEKIDLLVRYDARFRISYDGFNSNLRNYKREYDIFNDDKVVESLKYYNEISGKKVIFRPTLSENVDDPESIKKYIESFGIDCIVDYNGQILLALEFDKNNSIENYIKISEEKLISLKKDIYNLLISDKLREGSKYYKILYRFICSVENGNLLTLWRCSSALGFEISVNMNSDVLLCYHKQYNKIGKLSDIKSIRLKGFKDPIFNVKCKDCPFYVFCTFGCPLITDENSEEFKINCRNLKYFNEAFFNAGVKKLFDVDVLKIERCNF